MTIHKGTCGSMAILLVVLGTSRQAAGQVGVFWDNGQSTCGAVNCGTAELVPGYSDWWDVFITITNGSDTFSIRSTRDNIDRIRYVVVRSANPGGTTTILIGQSAPQRRFRELGAVLFSNDNDSQLGWTTLGTMHITGNVIGPIVAHGIQMNQSSQVNGDWEGDAVLLPHSTTRCLADIRVRGSIFGDILVSNALDGDKGEIGQIIARNGTIGTESNPVFVVTGRNVDLLRAGEINAYVFGWGADADSFIEYIQRLETYTTGDFGGVFTGTFRGLLDTWQIQNLSGQTNYIDCAGPMEALVRIGFGHQNNANYIRVPAGGMKGQTVFRALGGVAVWVRPFFVGDQSDTDDLNPKPHYLETSAEIGGGAVGQVPYGTHFTDCIPAQSGTDPYAIPTVAFGEIDDKNPIEIIHYGRVILPAWPQHAFKVERRPAGLEYSNPTPWTDETGCFIESLDETRRGVLLTPTSLPLQHGFEYRVSQQLNGSGNPYLMCDDVVIPSTPPPVDFFDFIPNTTTRRQFRFAVCGPSPGDADNNGCVNFADNTKVLENWGGTGCNKYGDANRDGAVDFADITSVLTNWQMAYCGGACASSIQQPSHDGFATLGVEGDAVQHDAGNAVLLALNSLGYPSIEAFSLALDNMTAEQRVFEMARLQQILAPNE